jgi:outer membrane protein assembly factor BamB
MPPQDNRQVRRSMKKIIIGIAIVIVIVAGVWYYVSHVQTTSIQKMVNNPSAYAGKELVIEGEVTDRTAFFGTLKFYKIKDNSGEIIVITKKSLPEVKSSALVKGKMDDAFALGDQKLVVFMEASIEKKDTKK